MILDNVNELDCSMNVQAVSYAGSPLSDTVMYISKKVERLLSNLEKVKGCIVFIEDTVDVPESISKNHVFIKSEMPQRDYAKYVTHIYEQRSKEEGKLIIHLAEGGYFISETAVVGENAVIEPGAFIGHNVIIGDNALVKTGATIKNTIAGDNFVVCENATVGTNGFTMADENGDIIRIPTLGKVQLGNNVEINALANVSCGSAGDTVIGDNVKIDSLVHIGHDVHIGKNVEIPAGAIVGGFCVINENAFIGINATLRNRITIGEKAFVGMGAVVTKSVPDGLVVVGNPSKPMEEG